MVNPAAPFDGAEVEYALMSGVLAREEEQGNLLPENFEHWKRQIFEQMNHGTLESTLEKWKSLTDQIVDQDLKDTFENVYTLAEQRFPQLNAIDSLPQLEENIRPLSERDIQARDTLSKGVALLDAWLAGYLRCGEHKILEVSEIEERERWSADRDIYLCIGTPANIQAADDDEDMLDDTTHVLRIPKSGLFEAKANTPVKLYQLLAGFIIESKDQFTEKLPDGPGVGKASLPWAIAPAAA